MAKTEESGAVGQQSQATAQFSSAAAGDKEFFICPACQGQVNANDLNEILQHHEHVIRASTYPGAR